jgi:hypothetical protein
MVTVRASVLTLPTLSTAATVKDGRFDPTEPALGWVWTTSADAPAARTMNEPL